MPFFLQVRVLYVRNLTQDCTEEKLKETFEQHGKIERVKKIKDYAFIHFEDRDQAVKVNKKIYSSFFSVERKNLKKIARCLQLIEPVIIIYIPFVLSQAMQELNGKEMSGSHMQVSLAKPPSDKKRKEEVLRARERRMLQMIQARGGGYVVKIFFKKSKFLGI